MIKMKALIVDDCALSRQLLIIGLDDWAEIDIAQNGKEALDMVKNVIAQGANYNLICMDLHMPVMDGHETMHEIRRLESEAGVEKSIVIMITSSNCPDDMLKAIIDGECNDYMMKPVMSKTFRKLLKKHGLIASSSLKTN
jgi:two-component system chemotaxis response regulator CheY